MRDEKDIRWFDVMMDHTMGMNVRQSSSDVVTYLPNRVVRDRAHSRIIFVSSGSHAWTFEVSSETRIPILGSVPDKPQRIQELSARVAAT
mmetsp:Transcript_115142/g.321853  ORF Transcript_115142/g.321853 Transcript_115142/m.321853 type:complete len:90 (-) Transcript_115142:229-498(-)